MSQSLTEKLEAVEAQIEELWTPLAAARESLVLRKLDRTVDHPDYKLWKKLDDKDTALRAKAADLRDEIEFAELED